MGAVSVGAHALFLSERLSEMCVYDFSHCIQVESKVPAGCCDFVSCFLWEVRPSADRYEELGCCLRVPVSVSILGVTTA